MFTLEITDILIAIITFCISYFVVDAVTHIIFASDWGHRNMQYMGYIVFGLWLFVIFFLGPVFRSLTVNFVSMITLMIAYMLGFVG